MLPILSEAWVIKKCEYLPSAEYPAVIITTPAMNLPRLSVTPEAVRNSVSMFSLITGARTGMSFRSSGSVAARQRERAADAAPIELAKTSAADRRVLSSMAERNDDLRLTTNPGLRESVRMQSIEYNRLLQSCGMRQ